MRWLVILVCIENAACRLTDLKMQQKATSEELIDAVFFTAKTYFHGNCLAFFYEKPSYSFQFHHLLVKIHTKWAVYLPAKGQNFENIYFYDGGIHSYTQCSFIITLKNRNYTSQVKNILYSVWNMDYSEGDSLRNKFIAVIDGEMSRPQAYDAMKLMFKFGDIDVLFFGLEDNVISVYTYFPYGIDRKSCPENNVFITRIAQWNGSFQSEVDLFPDKVPKNFYGCSFSVSTVYYPPFMYSTGVNEYDGIDYKMISILSEMMNATLKLTYYSELTGWIWVDREKRSVHGSLTDLRDGNVWATVSGIGNHEIHYRATLTQNPYVFSTLVWYFPNPRPVEPWRLVYLSFNSSMWLYTILATLITPVVVYALAKVSRVEYALENFGYCSIVLWSLAFGNSTGMTPKAGMFRLVFGAWLIYTLHLNNAYTASLTGLITGGKMESTVKTLDDIISKNKPTALMEYLDKGIVLYEDEKKYIKVLSKKIILNNYTEALMQVGYYRNACIMDNDVHIDFLIKEHKIPIYKTPVVLFSAPMGVMMRRNHFMFRKINRLILRIISSGINVKIIDDYISFDWGKNNPSWAAVTIKGLTGPFFILAIGCIISFFVFTSELLYKKYINYYIDINLRIN